MRPKYRLYPSLLDSFSWYKKSDSENALQEFLDRVNRIKTPPTDPMLRGIEFESLVNRCLTDPKIMLETRYKFPVHDTEVQKDVVQKFVEKLEGAAQQVFLSCLLETRFGLTEVYGYADFVKADMVADCKTTSKYDFPKFLNSYQRPAYLESLRAEGVKNFLFMVTDFNNYYEEGYTYNSADTDRFISGCNELIEFLEANRDKIKNEKVFGGIAF